MNKSLGNIKVSDLLYVSNNLTELTTRHFGL